MIKEWLQAFEHCRNNKDADGLANLFAAKFQFFENGSFENGDIYDKELLGKYYWKPLLEQESNLRLKTTVFSQQNDKYTVICDSSYCWRNSTETTHLTEIYLIELNASALCRYFYQVGQTREW